MLGTWRTPQAPPWMGPHAPDLGLGLRGVWRVLWPLTGSSSGARSQVLFYHQFYVKPQIRYYCCHFIDEKTKDLDPGSPAKNPGSALQPGLSDLLQVEYQYMEAIVTLEFERTLSD